MKKCPFCAEEIQDEAIKCRFCNEMVMTAPVFPKTKVPWYFNSAALWLSYLLFIPISVLWCVPLVWLHPARTQKNKIITTLVMIVIAIIIAQLIKVAVQSLTQYYGTIFQSSGISL